MTQGKVVLTGASGLIGSSILIDILKAGYIAHIVVRSEAKAKLLQEAPAIANLGKASACKYFIVPDLAVPGALDEATAGTALFVHCGTPLPFGDQTDGFLEPTVNCTLAALEASRTAGTVKRVIIMSSTGAFINPYIIGGDYEPAEEVVFGKEPNQEIDPPYPNALVSYCAAKTAAHRCSVEWMERSIKDGSINFDLILLAPGYCFGVHPLATSTSDLLRSSIKALLQVVIAEGPNRTLDVKPKKSLAGGVLLDDLVRAVHKCLDKEAVKTPDAGPSKGVASHILRGQFKWNDAYPIVARTWPNEVKKGLLVAEGDWPSKAKVTCISHRFPETFGFELSGMEGMLKAIVPQYVELREKELANGSVTV